MTFSIDLLDRASICDWSAQRLLVQIEGGFRLEILDEGQALRIQDVQLRWQLPTHGMPESGPRFETGTAPMAHLPCAPVHPPGTADASLERVRQVVRAHVRLAAIYPDLIWHAVERELQTKGLSLSFKPGAPVRCHRRIFEHCQVNIAQNERDWHVIILTQPLIMQATAVMTQVVHDGQRAVWARLHDSGVALFVVPPPLHTAHERLQHRARLHDHEQELRTAILPVLVP